MRLDQGLDGQPGFRQWAQLSQPQKSDPTLQTVWPSIAENGYRGEVCGRCGRETIYNQAYGRAPCGICGR